MDSKYATRLTVIAVAFGLGSVSVGCIPSGEVKQALPDVVPVEFNCARAFVDVPGLPRPEVILSGEAWLDGFLYESAQLHARSLVIERALAALEKTVQESPLDAERYACVGGEIQASILGLAQLGESLVQRAPVITSQIDDYCKANPLRCYSVGKRLAEATNQVRGSVQSLARSSEQAGRLFSQVSLNK